MSDLSNFMYVGPPEICDICKESYPLTHIVFDGRVFVCFYCWISEDTKQYE